VHNLAGIQLRPPWRATKYRRDVEHLLAALVSVGIDNVIVELNSPEVPIMDGSAAPFLYIIHEAGVKRLQAPRKYLKIVRPIAISRGDKRIALYPSDHFKVTYSISYDHPLLRINRARCASRGVVAEEVAPARTFTFLKDVRCCGRTGWRSRLARERDRARETGVLNNALRFETSLSATRSSMRSAISRSSGTRDRHLVAHRAATRCTPSSRRRSSRKPHPGVSSKRRSTQPRRRS